MLVGIIGQQPCAQPWTNALFKTIGKAEARRNDQQRQQGRNDQAADHDGAHWRAPLAVTAKRERGWHHAGGHRDRGHNDWLRTFMAGLHDGLELGNAARHFLNRKVDQQNGVFRNDTKEHQYADEHRH